MHMGLQTGTVLRVIVAGASIAILACACGRPPAAKSADLGLTVLSPSEIAINGKIYPEDAGTVAALSKGLVDELPGALNERGFRAVLSSASSRDLELYLSITYVDYTAFGAPTAKIRWTAQRNGEDAFAVDATCKTMDVEAMKRCATDALAASRDVAVLSEEVAVRRRETSASRTAAAPAHPAEPRASAPSASTGNVEYATGAPQPHAFALIVGIDQYRDVPAATGARRDAEEFARLARTALGIPADHTQVALGDRATKSDIEKHIEWLNANVPAGGNLFFFFSGHGAPDPSSGTPYVLPYDGDAKNLARTALRVDDVMRSLSGTKAKNVIVLLDSCFSGAGGRSVLPPGTRPLVRVKEAPASARLAVFSAASGAEISGPARNGGGLFTTVVLQALGKGRADIDGDGQITLQELHDWVTPRVAREAKKDSREQTPSVRVGADASADDIVLAWGIGR